MAGKYSSSSHLGVNWALPSPLPKCLLRELAVSFAVSLCFDRSTHGDKISALPPTSSHVEFGPSVRRTLLSHGFIERECMHFARSSPPHAFEH